MTTRVLLVDDDAMLADTLALGLRKRGYAVTVSDSGANALAEVAASDYAVVVTDLNMRGMSGLELCERSAANQPDLPVIVLTAFGSLDTAVAAIRAGAYDFISKPVALDALCIAIDRAARHRALGAELRRLQRQVAASSSRPEALIGDSAPMREVYDLVARVADSEATVLVTGESGTGKEVVARALHAQSRRREAPFVALNCAAVPEALLESELFGHVRGAFTDAKSAQPGLFARADGGTIFLDEIGDMPPSLQPKLLRVLQERAVRPVGGHAEQKVDVRVVAATNRDLDTAVDEGRFREDLYYRVNVVRIELPPLRARSGDVLALAHHFVARVAQRAGKGVSGFTAAAAEKLVAYAWPGNVRELQNCVERAVALARFEQIGVDDLPEKVRSYTRSHVLVTSDDPLELVSMDVVKRRYIARVMEAVGGNKTAAARILGYDRKRLYRVLERLGLSDSQG